MTLKTSSFTDYFVGCNATLQNVTINIYDAFLHFANKMGNTICYASTIVRDALKNNLTS